MLGGKDSCDITQVYQIKESRETFYKLVRSIFQTPRMEVTATYAFLKPLKDKQRLLGVYQQNIEGFDAAMLRSDADIPAHGP
jgi:NAD-dependent SIR2 family protein deacetylase